MKDIIKTIITGTFYITAIIIVADVTTSMYGYRIYEINRIIAGSTTPYPETIQPRYRFIPAQWAQTIQAMLYGNQPTAPTPETAQATQIAQAMQLTAPNQTAPVQPWITRTTQTNRKGKICNEKKCIYQTEIVEITCNNMVGSCGQAKIGKGTETEILQ